MSLNIKNEDTHRRAKKLARVAGETMTEAVDKAVAERQNWLRKRRSTKAVAEQLLEIGKRCSRLPVLDERTSEEMLYDDYRLPK